MASTSTSSSQENIKVYARIRPSSAHISSATTSKKQATFSLKTDPSTSTITIENDGKTKQFQVNKVYGQSATQESIFNDAGRSITDGFVKGINGTVFAYGQTGSGKSYTMLGLQGNPINHGLIPRTIQDTFKILKAKEEENPSTFTFSMKCSFLELYNEKFYDLLQTSDATIKIQSKKEQITVVGAAEFEVTTYEECMEHLWRGWNQRKVAETSMNRESSRSHAIFMLTLVTEQIEGSVVNRRTSRLNMVDLAGSERQTHTNNRGSRLREAGNINKSLLILARIIRTLATTSSSSASKQHIGFRDSLLTFLLRDSLGGNARTTVIVNIHPNQQFLTDTTSTLQFAESVQKIKIVATVNSTVTYFQKVNNTMDEILKKVQELQTQKEELLKNVMAFALNAMNTCPIDANTSSSSL